MSYVIIGNAPNPNLLWIKKSVDAVKPKTICYLDGAVDLKNDLALGNIDSIVLGDMDSCKSQFDCKKIEAPDQNYTDFQKALRYIKNSSANNEITIHCYNLTSGRMDHTMLNIRSLRSLQGDMSVLIHHELSIIEYVKNNTKKLHGLKVDDDIAVMSAPHAIVSSFGLKYEMQNYELNFGFSESCSNKVSSNNGVILNIRGEAIVIYPDYTVVDF